MKKIFLISAVLAIVFIFFLAIYNFAFKSKAPQDKQVTQVEKKAEVSVPVEKKKDKISLISKDSVIGAVIDKKTNKISYYSAYDGTTWQSDDDGSNPYQISAVKLPGLVSASWSPDKTKVLTVIEKDKKLNFFSYDTEKKKAVMLKDGLDNVSWDSLGVKIVYKYYDQKTKKRSLNIANPDGSGWQTIVEDIPFRDVMISTVPLSAFVSYWNSPNSQDETSLQIVSTTGGEVKNLLKGRYGADYLWSPDGSQALVSSLTSKDSKSTTLGLINMQGTYTDLNIPTLASKCAWSSDGKTIYYALPGGIPENMIMPNDYQKKLFTTEDTFWKVDISSGKRERIVELSDIKTAFDAYKPFVSPTEDALFFTNRIDGKLYKISL